MADDAEIEHGVYTSAVAVQEIRVGWSKAAIMGAVREAQRWRSTTILSVRRNDRVAMGSDGQVSLGSTIIKRDTRKVRWMLDRRLLVGFAGSTADAFAVMERFELRAQEAGGNLPRAAAELARDWRTDSGLRKLDAVMIVSSADHDLLISAGGEVVEPSDGIMGVGSGGTYAVAAARALLQNTTLSAAEIVRKSLEITADIDVYTNREIAVEEMARS